MGRLVLQDIDRIELLLSLQKFIVAGIVLSQSTLLIHIHPSIRVSLHKRLQHLVTQIALNPAKYIISTRSWKSRRYIHIQSLSAWIAHCPQGGIHICVILHFMVNGGAVLIDGLLTLESMSIVQ